MLIEKLLLNTVYCVGCSAVVDPAAIDMHSKLKSLAQIYRHIKLQGSSYWNLEQNNFLVTMLLNEDKIDAGSTSAALDKLVAVEPWRVGWGGKADLWIIKPVGMPITLLFI